MLGEKRSLAKRALFLLVALSIGLLLAGLVTEATFRVLLMKQRQAVVIEGPGGGSLHMSDERWGWKPRPGTFRISTEEFDTTGHVNELFMNDDPYDAAGDASRTRVLALGDSHTFGTGVSTHETWPNVLERRLNEENPGSEYRFYNAGVINYSLHNYLVRLIDQGPVLRPHYVVIGFSYATDLYDLLPPGHGGWINFDNARDYFDFDESGALVELHSIQRKPNQEHPARRVRSFLGYFATFQYLRRSKLSLAIGSRVRIGGASMWPNMDVVLEKEVSPHHEYQWRLAKAILVRTAEECERLGARLIVVGIPYLPQVYDDVWDVTFGGNPRYDRTAAIDRMRGFLESKGILYVDSLDGLRARANETGRWMHYRRDAHPTAEGHEVIADTIMRAVDFESR
ncbi:hypothetical protein MYX82_03270 [Acidobacteria bacterium AH-259-D05]|nr:hypothetical protein [Acidobacteria bacterium AH-259-D05]